MWNKKGYAGWGNHVLISGRGIPFNGRWYGATITCGWGWVGLHLLDPSSNHSLPITETLEPWTTNLVSGLLVHQVMTENHYISITVMV